MDKNKKLIIVSLGIFAVAVTAYIIYNEREKKRLRELYKQQVDEIVSEYPVFN